MITIKDYFELINYRITEGYEYGWSCFGSNVYCLSSHNEDGDEYNINVTFDKSDQRVYAVEVCDYKNNRAYRMIDPEYKTTHNEEAKERRVYPNQAWDDVDYVDLETDEDFLEKSRAIINDEEYDTRVSVPLTLDDEQLFGLMKQAHARDITLNQLVEEILRNVIELHETGTENPIDFPTPKKVKKNVAKMKGKRIE